MNFYVLLTFGKLGPYPITQGEALNNIEEKFKSLFDMINPNNLSHVYIAIPVTRPGYKREEKLVFNFMLKDYIGYVLEPN